VCPCACTRSERAEGELKGRRKSQEHTSSSLSQAMTTSIRRALAAEESRTINGG
jgi:hypothetical protein